MAKIKADRDVVASIKERIIRWEYPPNHPLGEELLGREFGVSRSPVREALRMLETAGFVSHVPNRGFFVRQFKSSEIGELYQVRLALETYAAEFLATHPETHPAVRALARPWRGLLEAGAPEDAPTLARIDETFHESLAALAGNGMLLAQLQVIGQRLYAFREMDYALVLEKGALAESCRSHLAVTQAITNGEPDAAREAVRANLAAGLGNVDKAMGRILLKTFNA